MFIWSTYRILSTFFNLQYKFFFSGNTPVVFMITPKVISLQEIKLAQTKTKITDMVAVRHPLSNGDYRTTLIILCEDGSLRMFLAAKEQTGKYCVISL